MVSWSPLIKSDCVDANFVACSCVRKLSVDVSQELFRCWMFPTVIKMSGSCQSRSDPGNAPDERRSRDAERGKDQRARDHTEHDSGGLYPDWPNGTFRAPFRRPSCQ
jgi:hypothetical protein